MKKIFLILFTLFSIQTNAEEIPNPNDENMRKVHGVVTDTDQVSTSKKGGNGPVFIGNLPVDIGILILDGIFNTRTNYYGFTIYHIKVNDEIMLNVGSSESFKTGDCVLVWYDNAMGDSPDLSMLGQAGIEKSSACNK